ncbi:tripartite tricarboxylate transporter substrate binding protein [Bradyrhizobium sp. LHD-71]|uniref:Bug family tripartite tricarboxylate transporter substrate binding protein n=1 Tax=Bradyrhizobium sp. LHD-71 TaxID=3072141 RepID=UPI00280FB8DE|nr:tripartite tricarboxylate transporter substrate binding protein [Bradyrhizobium sp. LHD-71]MDQ8732316.1 tripartite tricarboxylate transporter substrate binding protein [Bradyrhizobium sp. LHD-71]
MTFAVSGRLSPASGAPEAYPNRQITIVVPFSAGGATDVLARLIAERLHERWSQPVIVENRLGASGNVGAAAIATAPPDGYRLLMGAIGTNAVNASLFANMPYNIETDFAPVTQVARLPMVLAIHPALPVANVAELIALAKEKPGALNHGSAGKGASQHLACLLFESMTGTKFQQVFYRGAAAMLPDLLTGRIQLSFGDMASLLPSIKEGALKPLAVTTKARSPLLPNVPSISESGVAGFDASAWYGVFAPAKTSPDIVRQLNNGIITALKTPDMLQRLETLGAESVGSSPEEFAAFVKSEIARWGPIVKAAGVTAE